MVGQVDGSWANCRVDRRNFAEDGVWVVPLVLKAWQLILFHLEAMFGAYQWLYDDDIRNEHTGVHFKQLLQDNFIFLAIHELYVLMLAGVQWPKVLNGFSRRDFGTLHHNRHILVLLGEENCNLKELYNFNLSSGCNSCTPSGLLWQLLTSAPIRLGS